MEKMSFRHCLIVCFFVLLSTLAIESQEKQSLAKPAPSGASLDVGEIVNGVYRNAGMGFTYRVPYGWVDRTAEMRGASTDPEKANVLLAIFERPPEATGNTVNSSVVFAFETASSYPGLKSAAQYFGPLSELTTAKGFEPVNEPYEFPVDAKPIVRRDFIKQRGSVGMHQSTLAWLTKGDIVSFTFIGASDEEVQGLLEWLKFENVRHTAKHPSNP
jgi:hypothetical protein